MTSAQLLTPADAATRLGISQKTLAGHVRDGSIRWVNVGRGKAKPRRMFAESDVQELIERQSRRDGPCRSTN